MSLIRALVWIFAGFPAFYCASQSMDDLLEDVRHSQFEEQYQTVLVGEQEVVVVVQDSSTAITRGVAVILSEAGKGPFNHQGLSALTKHLNQVGWVTLLMPAPESGFKIPDAPPSDTEQQSQATDPADQPDSAQGNEVIPKAGLTRIHPSSFTQQEQQLKLQMQAIVPITQQYPGFFLVIAQGTSAAWLTKIYSEKQIALPDAMVAVSPYWPQRQYNIQLPKWLAETEIPYLDIYTPWDPQWAKNTIAQRKIQATKSLKLMYRQRELIGQPLDEQQYAFLGKEIYGWLTHMGW